MRKLVLRNSFSPGDIILLTAAVRDLHVCYPNQFLTDVRTPFPELWQNNPYISALDENDKDVETIDCNYPLIHTSNERPYHAIHGFIDFLSNRLKLTIRPSAFKGDIHLSAEEKSWDSQINEIVGADLPFWIVVAGGKFDVTVKWWDHGRYQQVIDHFRDRIQFVQIGAEEHYHPPLHGVIDLRGQTSLRQLVRLVYHSQGALCPITLTMHLAAAVEVKNNYPKNRPCVVIAGGREPPHWEAYPHHQFVHVNGALPCCDNGGCWKSRTRPLGDGDERDRPENLCVDPVGNLPRCMDLITPREVVRRIETYFNGTTLQYLTSTQARAGRQAVSQGDKCNWNRQSLEIRTFSKEAEKAIKQFPTYPKHFKGRGIVICAGGPKLFANAWVCINILRKLGCALPIQLWYLGKEERVPRMEALVKPLGVSCVDAMDIRQTHPTRQFSGWVLKAYAILRCSFQDVLLLDADNVPVVNPDFLFQTPQFKRTAAIFWPDFGRLAPSRSIWKACGVRYRDEPEFESGQIVVNKKKCWQSLNLALWYNEHCDYFYEHIHGDKDTFHMAFRKTGQDYAMPRTPIHRLPYTMCQHDFEGRRIFQHRNLAKWDLNGNNRRIPDFWFEDDCLQFLDELHDKWNGTVRKKPPTPSRLRQLSKRVESKPEIKPQAPVTENDEPADDQPLLTVDNARQRMEQYIKTIPDYPGSFAGRGIVTCAGGSVYFTCAWVCLNMLRRLGCRLPVQLWYLGPGEVDSEMTAIMKRLDVECVDASEVRKRNPARRLKTYELKPYALLHCPFKEVLLLDADNVPLVDPAFLFDLPQFKEMGAIFWPDVGRLKANRPIWRICGLEPRDEQEFESGQIVIDKERGWRPLSLTMWFNEYSDFFYRYLLGDKDTFHMAFRKLGQPFAMPDTPARALEWTLCQHDFEGRRIFQHRNADKWRLHGGNHEVLGFRHEALCKRFVKQLRRIWRAAEVPVPQYSTAGKTGKVKEIARGLTGLLFDYERIGHDRRPMAFCRDGSIGHGAADCERFWDVREHKGQIVLIISSEKHITCKLTRQQDGVWTGRWVCHECMPVRLTPRRISFRKSVARPPGSELVAANNTILIRAPLNAYTGYGLHACQIVSDLQQLGFNVKIRAIVMTEAFAPLPKNVRNEIFCEEQTDDWELLLHPPGYPPTPSKRTVYFTMWESTRLPERAVRALNEAECVVVPCQWNASCFNASGVEKPVRVVPLGIDTSVFKAAPMDMDGPCIFGAAGRLESGGTRKGIADVIKVFQQAFPNEKDVQLRVKIFPDCPLPRIDDPRVRFTRRYLPPVDLAKWFAGLTCFVSAARAEAWGLMQHQALATGRPIISIRFGGLTEFFAEDMGYSVNFQLVTAEELYAGCGLWADPDEQHMIERMREVYMNREEARCRGEKGAMVTKAYSWRRSTECLVQLLKEVGMVK
jgi:glycosyltransferase involved in cell wall biosynthesis/ADP-heptose:LPS heptosyltransferase